MDDDTVVTATFDGTAAATETCATPGGTLTLGEYMVENGTYGNAQSASPISGYAQCATLTAGTADGAVNAAWTWWWPFTTPVITRATPAIVYGFKPWSPSSTTPNLPAVLGDVGALTIDAAVEQLVGDGQRSRVVVADGQTRGVFPPDWWVAEVETAAWVDEGTGGLGLTNYKVGFQPAALQ